MLNRMAPGKTILIIDDDDDLRDLLREQLELGGDFAVETAQTAAAGEILALRTRPHLVLLDVDLPDGDGRDVCARLRRAGLTAPVIMLTAASGEAETILGLESGATDYVTKPFKLNVLMARIRAHLRTHEQAEDVVLHIGPYEFRPGDRILRDPKGRKLRLTDKEANILKYLYRAGAKAVTRDELLSEVWGYNASVTTHTLETHIYRLRQKIEPDPAHARILVTEPGGYRLAP
jgi:DNA-binding response OmpR family regulator